ncbi:MAG TPA: rhomboid family intramembrane serine protease [Candidatus Saccharimonadales bacterium]|nr:rhomboid family intramembrane serine protease [Candidatus Saccharimonadales bacterium]
MFPLSDSAKAGKFPFMTWILILANIAAFIYEITNSNPDAFINQYALVPSHVNWGNYITLIPFVTAIFLHGGFLHILSNMWFLFIFGDNVEEVLSPLGFLLLFLISGILGNVLQYSIMPHSTIPILGASGAIAGVLGCYYKFFPYSKVKTLLFVFFFVTIVDINAPLILGYWFILQLISGVGSLSQSSSDGGVAFFAHVAGFLVGIAVAKLLQRRVSVEYLS